MHLVTTRHLQVARDRLDPSRWLFLNLYYGSRMSGGEETWEVLAAHDRPAPARGCPEEERARAARLLVGAEEPAGRCPFLEGLEEALPGEGSLRERLARAREAVLARAASLGRRGKELGHYLWDDPGKLCRVVFDHAEAFLDGEVGQPQGGMESRFARLAAGRPPRQERYEQQPCTLATTLARAARIRQRLPQKGRVLVLGDDDLVSLALEDAEVLEIDGALVAYLEDQGVPVFPCDLTRGLPEAFRGRYRAVVTDPMYEARGMACFVRCCSQALRPGGWLFLSTCPDLLEDAPGLFRLLRAEGFRREAHRPRFNRYPFPEEPRRATLEGMARLGLPVELFRALLRVPFLYADWFEYRKG